MSNFLHSWSSVERGCIDYLSRVLGTIEGVQGYNTDALPRTMPDDATDFYIWTFRIDGGAEVVHRNNRTQINAGAWKMDAVFQSWSTTDYLAKQIAGAVIDAMPALGADGIEGLARLYHTAWPTREWVLRNVLNDDRAGDERRFVQMTLNMECGFGNVPRIE